jgi:hypothetical protein
MGNACDIYGRWGGVDAGLWFGNLNDRKHLDELGIVKRMAL